MKRIDVDLLAGLAALAFAGVALYVPDVERLIAPAHTIAAFGVAALGRWYARARKAQGLAGLDAGPSGDPMPRRESEHPTAAPDA